jgi:predicted DNA-binding transcriptional regulator AlpA
MSKKDISQGGSNDTELLTAAGVARMCSMSKRTVMSLKKAGVLPYIAFSKRCLRFPRKAVLEALAQRTIGMN